MQDIEDDGDFGFTVPSPAITTVRSKPLPKQPPSAASSVSAFSESESSHSACLTTLEIEQAKMIKEHKEEMKMMQAAQNRLLEQMQVKECNTYSLHC